MITNTTSIVQDLSKLKDSLKEKIRLVMDRKNFSNGNGVLRVEETITNIDPLKWLRQQKDNTRVYWSERDNDFEMAGVGVADIIGSDSAEPYKNAFNKMRSVLNGGENGLRYYGGFRFDQSKSSDGIWEDFGVYRFVIPELEIVRSNGRTKLALNVRFVGRSDSFDNLIEVAIGKIEHQSKYKLEKDAEINSRSDIPDKRGWFRSIEKSKQMLRKSELKKIVLARRSMFHFSQAIDATHIMAQMKTLSVNAFHFCLQPAKEVAFIGVSPELLYRREGSKIFSEAVAGTKLRGENQDIDEELANQLLGSRKDIHEHALVCKWIEQSLMRLCNSYESDERVQVLKSSQVQHLYKRYRGVLKECDDAGIISMLHPTPAVAGTPQNKSLQGVRKLEVFDRGWYAGPVGWVGSNSAEFAVGIRSGLVDQDKIFLFSGAGILPDSNAEQEWQELEHKIGHFLKLFKTDDN